MAQRSARARSKADKISAASIPPAQIHAGISKPTTFNPYTGLLTPAASSVGTSSSRSAHSFSFNYRSSGSLPTGRKSAIRSFLEQSDKVRRGLEERLSRATGNSTSRKDVLGSLETGWASMGSMKQWEGGGKGNMGMEKPTRDNELWFPDGDTLVYLCEPHHHHPQHVGNQYQPAPTPSFRIKSQWLRDTGSSFLIASIQDRVQRQQIPTRPLTPPDVPIKTEPGLERMSSLTQTPTNSGARYEIFFPPPFTNNRETIMKHNLSTRNFIALLANKPLVGHTLGTTIMELVERLDTWIPSGAAGANTVGPNVQRILNYLQAREFDDVRNSPELAAGILVFAERFHLAELWQEAFVHCVGMLGRLEKLPEYKEFSAITVAFMDRASLDITVRLQNADALFANFDFHEMWPISSHPFSAGARQAFDRFQKYLIKHYQGRYGSWPPSQEAIRYGTSKFTRLIYNNLMQDFSSLYEYLVDASITWSPAPTASPLLKSSQPFHEDPTLPIIPMLTNYDRTHSHPPLHNPYPLLPPPPSSSQTAHTTHHLKTGFLKPRHPQTPTQAMNALLLQNSTNISALSRSPTPLIEAYRLHERAESTISPREARIGRWVLIYGVLQTLGSLGGDVPGLKWSEGVEYFLNAKVAGTPPWKPQEAEDNLYSRASWWKEVEKSRVLNSGGAVGGENGMKIPEYLQGRDDWELEGEESGDEADNEEDDEKDLRELSEGLGLNYEEMGWRRGSVVMGGT